MALAIEGAALILVDNIEGQFGSKALAAALTSMTWKDRVLGLSETREAPLSAVWLLTGNNIGFRTEQLLKQKVHLRWIIFHEHEARVEFLLGVAVFAGNDLLQQRSGPLLIFPDFVKQILNICCVCC